MSALSRIPKHYDTRFITELVQRLESLERAANSRTKDVVIGLPDALLARGVAAPRLVLISPNGSTYRVKIDNAGALTTELVP